MTAPTTADVLALLAEWREAKHDLDALRGTWTFGKDPTPPEWRTVYNREVEALNALLDLPAAHLRLLERQAREEGEAVARLRDALKVCEHALQDNLSMAMYKNEPLMFTAFEAARAALAPVEVAHER